VEHEVQLERNKANIIAWMCGLTLKERKKNLIQSLKNIWIGTYQIGEITEVWTY